MIRNEHEFNQFLTTKAAGSRMALLDMASCFMQENHEIVLTHGDLHPRNIMVTEHDQGKEIKVEVLIDWEMCGWYPAYREYVKALNTYVLLMELWTGMNIYPPRLSGCGGMNMP